LSAGGRLSGEGLASVDAIWNLLFAEGGSKSLPGSKLALMEGLIVLAIHGLLLMTLQASLY
jgi:hypothetical protein